MQELQKKIIINRIFLFSFSMMATPIAIMLFWADNSFEWNELFFLLMFFTIWSNIFVFFWSVFSLINIYIKSEILNKLIEHWFFKTSITLCILITGIVFNFVLLPAYIFSGRSFSKMVLFLLGSSLFQHILVPIFMVRDFFLTKGCEFKEKQNKTLMIKKTLVSTIIPLFWLVLSLIFISVGILEPQYSFMNVFDTSGWKLAMHITTLTMICISWIIGFYLLLLYSNKTIIE